MRRNRNAKIVATLGPASSIPELIRALFDAGADVFRLNFSHGTHDDHKRRFDAIRAIERDVGRPIGILQDLQGPQCGGASTGSQPRAPPIKSRLFVASTRSRSLKSR
jgi:pyruvate kinase